MITMKEREEKLAILQKKYPTLEQIREAGLILSSLSFPSSFSSDTMIKQKFDNLEEILKELKGEREI
jgi:hypothetical protein